MSAMNENEKRQDEREPLPVAKAIPEWVTPTALGTTILAVLGAAAGGGGTTGGFVVAIILNPIGWLAAYFWWLSTRITCPHCGTKNPRMSTRPKSMTRQTCASCRAEFSLVDVGNGSEAERERAAEEEQTRLAGEAERKRVAEKAQQHRRALEEQTRLAKEAERKRLAEKEQKRKAEAFAAEFAGSATEDAHSTRPVAAVSFFTGVAVTSFIAYLITQGGKVEEPSPGDAFADFEQQTPEQRGTIGNSVKAEVDQRHLEPSESLPKEISSPLPKTEVVHSDEVEFMGIKAEGTRITFVIDDLSLYTKSLFPLILEELEFSLDSLSARQKFAVVLSENHSRYVVARVSPVLSSVEVWFPPRDSQEKFLELNSVSHVKTMLQRAVDSVKKNARRSSYGLGTTETPLTEVLQTFPDTVFLVTASGKNASFPLQSVGDEAVDTSINVVEILPKTTAGMNNYYLTRWPSKLASRTGGGYRCLTDKAGEIDPTWRKEVVKRIKAH